MNNAWLVIGLVVIPVMAFGAVMQPKTGSGEVSFVATASPGALAIKGKGESPGGKLDISEMAGKFEVSGTVKIKMDSLSTGIALRDTHMKDKYLEAGKFPEALLILARQSLPKTGSGPFEGELVLHGTKHHVSGVAEVVFDGSSGSVKASFPVRLQDHGITAPAFAGISVADEVRVETKFDLVAN